MKDKEIIERLKNGDESGLKHLYRHQKMIKSWINKNNGNGEDAEDLFQNAILVFYKKVMSGDYEYKSKISTYLFSICQRQWLNELNRRKSKEQTTEDFMKFDKGVYEKPMEDGSNEKLIGYITEQLNKLGEPCKSLLEASIYLQVSMKDIASKYNYKNAHSARQQKLRCLQRLRGGMNNGIIQQLR
ncbi:sigma-70 family RNA polymerase sigma factor [Flavivirga amylovorans]|uniref:Sigma-70 family RNA polymerase sigma factor n=1 Tax=Flavivirga amylovorans TaxID=870486 RepID=A0ABT8WX37_9FLAO|nr:sigma-70 family RNA polymerase sigma factor [Flavivirga amylovorans]MDO5986249.1 sigma-70 family RNA polymerase sigma factor [Flavivirga amylovorans]